MSLALSILQCEVLFQGTPRQPDPSLASASQSVLVDHLDSASSYIPPIGARSKGIVLSEPCFTINAFGCLPFTACNSITSINLRNRGPLHVPAHHGSFRRKENHRQQGLHVGRPGPSDHSVHRR